MYITAHWSCISNIIDSFNTERPSLPANCFDENINGDTDDSKLKAKVIVCALLCAHMQHSH